MNGSNGIFEHYVFICTLNGHSALYLWYALLRKGIAGLKLDVKNCIRKSSRDLLEQAEMPCNLNKLSCTVVFEHPKWQLACEGDIAHVVVMPSISAEKIIEFVADLIACRKQTNVIDVSE